MNAMPASADNIMHQSAVLLVKFMTKRTTKTQTIKWYHMEEEGTYVHNIHI